MIGRNLNSILSKNTSILYLERLIHFSNRSRRGYCTGFVSIINQIFDDFRIDFFSLDIEGAEMEVLRTIPWDKVSIELILIEVKSNSFAFLKQKCYFQSNKVNVTELIDYMAGNGYEATAMPPFDHMFVKQ